MITPSRTSAIDLPCSAGRLLRAARVLTRHYDDALRPVGITITQFGLLKVIQRLEPESISDIAQALDIDRTTLSRNLKPLEKAGLVFRGSEGESRRRRVLLTTLGVAKLEEAQPFWQAAGRCKAPGPLWRPVNDPARVHRPTLAVDVCACRNAPTPARTAP